ncbi:MAG: hypothetical protein KGI37_10120 [Alphaproteobacteria bacterium]|nr:hypothetical protein [Alphaproteobacteria bacterium]
MNAFKLARQSLLATPVALGACATNPNATITMGAALPPMHEHVETPTAVLDGNGCVIAYKDLNGAGNTDLIPLNKSQALPGTPDPSKCGTNTVVMVQPPVPAPVVKTEQVRVPVYGPAPAKGQGPCTCEVKKVIVGYKYVTKQVTVQQPAPPPVATSVYSPAAPAGVVSQQSQYGVVAGTAAELMSGAGSLASGVGIAAYGFRYQPDKYYSNTTNSANNSGVSATGGTGGSATGGSATGGNSNATGGASNATGGTSNAAGGSSVSNATGGSSASNATGGSSMSNATGGASSSVSNSNSSSNSSAKSLSNSSSNSSATAQNETNIKNNNNNNNNNSNDNSNKNTNDNHNPGRPDNGGWNNGNNCGCGQMTLGQ